MQKVTSKNTFVSFEAEQNSPLPFTYEIYVSTKNKATVVLSSFEDFTLPLSSNPSLQLNMIEKVFGMELYGVKLDDISVLALLHDEWFEIPIIPHMQEEMREKGIQATRDYCVGKCSYDLGELSMRSAPTFLY